jgi:hypothetical protein
MDSRDHTFRSLASALVSREQHGQESRFAGVAANSRGIWQRMAMDPKKGLLIGHKGKSEHTQLDDVRNSVAGSA